MWRPFLERALATTLDDTQVLCHLVCSLSLSVSGSFLSLISALSKTDIFADAGLLPANRNDYSPPNFPTNFLLGRILAMRM